VRNICRAKVFPPLDFPHTKTSPREGSREPRLTRTRAGFLFNQPFSPMAHRSGRVIGTDALRVFLVLHVSSDSQEREQGTEDNPNVNAASEQTCRRIAVENSASLHA
jgi:hypothetical protein